MCYSPWGHKEADTTEGLTQQQQSLIQTFWQFLIVKLELPKAYWDKKTFAESRIYSR